MEDERKLRRMHVVSYLKVHERNTDQSVGRVTDITTEGIRLCSKEPIKENSTIQFKMKIPRVTAGSDEITFDALVIWCHKSTNPELYDSGVQLLDVPPKDIDIIEQFIEDSSFNDRWLSIAESLPYEY